VERAIAPVLLVLVVILVGLGLVLFKVDELHGQAQKQDEIISRLYKSTSHLKAELNEECSPGQG